ncbi:unnamed protein product [Microthlaspi erraticum]|uniref:Uncharacterized protein n=1 Tax=Microthlaspi erraticum TaxID=1685480 RepID=A0A6D2KHM2_9BRAS|nr:unnamed protein product [Microthlaspi erraticum]
MFLRNSTSSKIPRAFIVSTCGYLVSMKSMEKSIVMLLVHREFFLLLLRLSCGSTSSIGSSWLLLLTSQPTDSPLLLPLHSQSHHFLPPLNKVHSNLKLPLLTLTTNGVPPFFPQSLTLRLSSSEYTYPSASDSSIL